jgi:hypothetical protein
MPAERISHDWAVAALCVALFWLGILLGVAFLATPAKFLAPSLTLPVALDIGRATFAIFNKVEWALCVALLFPAVFGVRAWIASVATIVVVASVAVETLWLLPLLDRRVGQIIAGVDPASSGHHNLYIALDGLKLVALIVVAWVMARRVVRAGRADE